MKTNSTDWRVFMGVHEEGRVRMQKARIAVNSRVFKNKIVIGGVLGAVSLKITYFGNVAEYQLYLR